MALTTGKFTRGYVVILEDATGAWVLCRDGCWVDLGLAVAGSKPMATRVRLCPDMKRAHRYARQHSFTTSRLLTGGERRTIAARRPRVISARAAGLPQEVCQ